MRLATRGSALARAQAELAAAALRRCGAVCELLVVRTRGDLLPGVPAERMEGQGWFTAELEAAVLDGRADVAVHSAKDLPTVLAAGLGVVAHLERGDPRDALVLRRGESLDDLGGEATVGTSSPRRAALLGAIRPGLRTVPMRGNVDTRLRKLDGGEVDALLLACAGLDRLGLAGRATVRLDPTVVVPAPAQGALALEAAEEGPLHALLAAADHAPTSAAVVAERTVLRELGGGCRLPLGAWARIAADGALELTAALGGEAGEVRRTSLRGDVADPVALGVAAAAELLR